MRRDQDMKDITVLYLEDGPPSFDSQSRDQHLCFKRRVQKRAPRTRVNAEEWEATLPSHQAAARKYGPTK